LFVKQFPKKIKKEKKSFEKSFKEGEGDQGKNRTWWAPVAPKKKNRNGEGKFSRGIKNKEIK
jgi:hypothetical protein